MKIRISIAAAIVVAMTANIGAYAENASIDSKASRKIDNGCVNPNDADDIMVPVGDFCVDKYEASVWSKPSGGTQYGATSDNYPCNDNGQDCAVGAANPIYARSVVGVKPSANMTWFQANIACANAGKRLLTNAEWQAAAAGTPDPGATGTAPNCNVSGSGPTTTGAGTNCLSTAGAENMIGSLDEAVAEWGMSAIAVSDPNTVGMRVELDGPTTGYNNDIMLNISGSAYSHYNGPGWTAGLAQAIFRGGSWGSGDQSGVFCVNAANAPSNWHEVFGFRCGKYRAH